MGKINVILNFNLKNILKALTIILGISFIVIIFMCFQKYETSELTPSIIISTLQENEDENIFSFKTTEFLEKSILNSNFNGCKCQGTLYLTHDYPLISANEILKNKKDIQDCCGYTIQWMNYEYSPHIQVWDKSLKVYFEIFYNEKNIPYYFTLRPEFEEYNDDYTRKINRTMVDYRDIILKNYGFTTIQNNKDYYLVKDLGDNFLICEMMDVANPFVVSFKLYKKQKYLNKKYLNKLFN